MTFVFYFDWLIIRDFYVNLPHDYGIADKKESRRLHHGRGNGPHLQPPTAGGAAARLYKRNVWCILYRHVYPQLSYGLADEIRQLLKE